MIHGLTPTERAHLSMVAGGMRAREIAEKRGISINSVNSSLARVRHKLGANSIANAVGLAVFFGEISLSKAMDEARHEERKMRNAVLRGE